MALVAIYAAVAYAGTTYAGAGAYFAAQVDKNLRDGYLERVGVYYDKGTGRDPLNAGADLGRADIYIRLGLAETALEILQTGYRQTQCADIKEKMLALTAA